MNTHQGPPPAGGDRSRGSALLIVSVVTYALAVIATALRMFGRVYIVHQVGWDDFTIIAATAISALGTAFTTKQIESGAGRHEYYLNAQQLSQQNKWHSFAQDQLFVSTALAKISACLFLIRIVNKNYLKRWLYVLIASLVAVNGATFIMLVTQCRPLPKVWDPLFPGHCWSIKVVEDFGYVAGSWAVFTDLILSGLPILFLRKVQISRRTKVALCGLMSLGLVASVFSLIKIALLPQLGLTKDATWTQIPLQIYATFEENLYIIAVNMPLMRPIYGVIEPKINSGFDQLVSSLKGRLSSSHKTSTTLLSQRSGSNSTERDWRMPLHGIVVEKETDLHVSQQQGTENIRLESTPWANHSKTESARDWV